MLNPESSQPARLHAGCDQTLAEHLSAEKLVRKSGKLVWASKSNAPNHLFDCLYLSAACADASWTPSLPHYVLQIQAAERAAQAPKPEQRGKNIQKHRRPEAESRWG